MGSISEIDLFGSRYEQHLRSTKEPKVEDQTLGLFGDYQRGMNLGSKFLTTDFNENKQNLGLCFQSSEVHQAQP